MYERHMQGMKMSLREVVALSAIIVIATDYVSHEVMKVVAVWQRTPEIGQENMSP